MKNYLSVLIGLFFLALYSCSKSEGQLGTTVKINLVGAEIENNSLQSKVNRTNKEDILSYSQTEGNFGTEKYHVSAFYTEDAGAIRTSTGQSSDKYAATKITTRYLEPGVLYRVIAYDASGNYVEDHTFKSGTANSAEFTKLTAGKTYTFISYSTGSLTQIVDIDRSLNLTDASLSISNEGNNFMYYIKPSFELSQGQNQLSIVLKHIYTQVTLSVDASALGGSLTNLQGTFNPHHQNPSIKLENGAITYGNTTSASFIQFNSISGALATADAVNICSPYTEQGVLQLEFKIDGKQQSVTIPNLTFKPSVKYNLNIKFEQKPDGIKVGALTWAGGNLLYKNGTYGFAEKQSDTGDNWMWNWLLPRNLANEMQDWQYADKMSSYSADRDPCKKVSSAWRTPTQADIQSLLNVKQQETTSLNGVRGIYIGEKVFLPMIPTEAGSYWLQNIKNGHNSLRLHFGGQTTQQQWLQFNENYRPTGMQIRCVKD